MSDVATVIDAFEAAVRATGAALLAGDDAAVDASISDQARLVHALEQAHESLDDESWAPYVQRLRSLQGTRAKHLAFMQRRHTQLASRVDAGARWQARRRSLGSSTPPSRLFAELR